MKQSILLILSLFISMAAQALTFQSVQDGDWSNPCTWGSPLGCPDNPPTAIPGTNIPGENDLVVVSHHVTLDMDVTLTRASKGQGPHLPALTIEEGASLTSAAPADPCNEGFSLTIGGTSGAGGYAGIQVDGELAVTNLTLIKTTNPVSIINTNGSVLVHGFLDTTNNGDVNINGTVDVNGDWHVGNGNAESAGTGFLLVQGCVNNNTGGQTGNIEVAFCVITPEDCECLDDTEAIDVSAYTSLDCSMILPVEISSFSGRQVDKFVHLYWTTTMEEDNDFFVIESSHDGREFVDVGTVKGGGDSQGERDYTFVDHIPFSGTSYYRLRQTDEDGDSFYSEVIEVSNKTEEVKLSLYPNPASIYEHAKLKVVGLNPNETVVVEVHQLNGENITVESVTATAAGNIQLRVAASAVLPAGLYFVTVYAHDKVHTEKMLIR